MREMSTAHRTFGGTTSEVAVWKSEKQVVNSTYMNCRKVGNLFQVCWKDFGANGAEHSSSTSSDLVGFILDSLFCRSE
jgi:hypothetical protein